MRNNINHLLITVYAECTFDLAEDVSTLIDEIPGERQ